MISLPMMAMVGSPAKMHIAPPRQPASERICGDPRPCRDPLPFAELIGVGQRAVTEAVAGDTDAANRAIDPMQHGLIVDVNDAGMNSVSDALGAGEIGRDDCGREAVLRCVGEF